MAVVRRILGGPDRTVIHLVDVSYRGDYLHLEMDLKPSADLGIRRLTASHRDQE